MRTKNNIPCHCFRLRRAGNKLTERYNAHLAECGLTATRFALLSNIDQNQPISTSRLAEMMSLDRTTLVRNLKSLEKAGYISFSNGKGRERPVSLTEKGKEIQTQGLICWEKAQKELEDALGSERLELFREITDIIDKM